MLRPRGHCIALVSTSFVRGMFRNDWHASNVIKIRKEYEKNTRGNTSGNPAAGDNTRKSTRIIQDGRARSKNTRKIRELLALSFFFELSYLSRIFARAGPAAKIREKYESSRNNERPGPGRPGRPSLSRFSSSSRIFLVFLRGGPAAKLREKYESSRNNERPGPGRPGRPSLSRFSSSSRMFPVFFSYFCGAGPQQKYEKNARARGITRSPAPAGRADPRSLVFLRALVFFPYFSRTLF